MKEKIGIEKLIELLNEYEKKAVVHWYEWYGQDVLMCRYIKDNFEFYTDEATTIAISKYYGFIKWLVDNDKIDLDKCGLDVRHYLSYNKRYDKGIVMAENCDNDTFVVREFYSPYEQLLMLLSISDTPIDDLISYLK